MCLCFSRLLCMSRWQKICPALMKPPSIIRHDSILYIIGAIYCTLLRHDLNYNGMIAQRQSDGADIGQGLRR